MGRQFDVGNYSPLLLYIEFCLLSYEQNQTLSKILTNLHILQLGLFYKHFCNLVVHSLNNSVILFLKEWRPR